MDVDPGALRITHYPDPVLRRKAAPIERVDDAVRAVAARMIELMREAPGIGLAAPQVGLPWRLFVAHVPEHPDDPEPPGPDVAVNTAQPQVYINPTLSDFSRDMVLFEEGCLSLPDIRGDVRRPERVTISALDIEGQPFTQQGAGLLARCWQHEADHLDGVLILDRFTQAARMRTRAAVRALEGRA